jgi:hypothetical protein
MFFHEQSIGTSSALLIIESSIQIVAMDFLWDSNHPESSIHRYPGPRDGHRLPAP